MVKSSRRVSQADRPGQSTNPQEVLMAGGPRTNSHVDRNVKAKEVVVAMCAEIEDIAKRLTFSTPGEIDGLSGELMDYAAAVGDYLTGDTQYYRAYTWLNKWEGFTSTVMS